MLKTKATQTIHLILVLLLLVAPFEVLFASSTHAGAHDEVVEMAGSMANSHIHQHDVDNADDHATSLSNDCEKKCAHCVFCSAAVVSPHYVNTHNLSVFNPHISQYLFGVVSDLTIQPPISI